MNQKIRVIGLVCLLAIWATLTGFAWFGAPEASSEAERRPLEQFPELTAQTLFNGKFMSEFEDYTLDQFPGRDAFRQVKSLFHYYVLNQKDNNDIYVTDGYAAKQEYPLNQDSVAHAMDVFNKIYNTHLKEEGSNVFMSVIPDKGYYLADKSGHLALDYDTMFSMVQEGAPWATYVDITDVLSSESYYYTDTHWRQEHLLGVAQKLSDAMGVTAPAMEDFTVTQVDRPFYGVYYGQAALPLPAETMYFMESQLLKECQVYIHETGKYAPVYDPQMLNSQDLYDIFLSGPKSLLTIENPNASTDRELIIFRDSFGSSVAPLLVQDYKTVTLVDIRYMNSALLDRFVDFHGQDVLFLYSTLVLNSDTGRMQ